MYITQHAKNAAEDENLTRPTPFKAWMAYYFGKKAHVQGTGRLFMGAVWVFQGKTLKTMWKAKQRKNKK